MKTYCNDKFYQKGYFLHLSMISDAMQLLSVKHPCIACTLCVWKSNKFIENRKKMFERIQCNHKKDEINIKEVKNCEKC